MRRYFGVGTVAVLAVVLIFGSSAQAASDGPTELKFTTYVPSVSSVGTVYKEWTKKVAEQSNGRLKIKVFPGSSLVNQPETIRAVMSGTADIGYYTIGSDEGLMPLNTVTRLPLMRLPNQIAAAEIHSKLLAKFPEMVKEFRGLKTLGVAAMPPEQMFFTKKEVRVPADIKGMKIVARGEWTRLFVPAGAAAMSLSPADWYTSLDRGLVEGHVIKFLAAKAFKTLELYKSHTIFSESGSGLAMSVYLMNPDKWKRLPPDLQKILADSIAWVVAEEMKRGAEEQNEAKALAKKMNHTFSDLEPKEMQLWGDLAQPIHDKWIADNADKGPTKEIYDEIQRLKKQYTKQQ
jgi:TRAP-type C4-dicarboxylate transport system substrate-binding protein